MNAATLSFETHKFQISDVCFDPLDIIEVSFKNANPLYHDLVNAITKYPNY